jgi:hypothetical protein
MSKEQGDRPPDQQRGDCADYCRRVVVAGFARRLRRCVVGIGTRRGTDQRIECDRAMAGNEPVEDNRAEAGEESGGIVAQELSRRFPHQHALYGGLVLVRAQIG